MLFLILLIVYCDAASKTGERIALQLQGGVRSMPVLIRESDGRIGGLAALQGALRVKPIGGSFAALPSSLRVKPISGKDSAVTSSIRVHPIGVGNDVQEHKTGDLVIEPRTVEERSEREPFLEKERRDADDTGVLTELVAKRTEDVGTLMRRHEEHRHRML
jgi:hypothetical protein